MPLNHDDFIKSVKKGYSKQKTLLDKMIFLFNIQVYKEQLNHIREGISKYFSEDEKALLPYKDKNEAKADRDIVEEANEYVVQDILRTYKGKTTELAATWGILKAHIQTEYGKVFKAYDDGTLKGPDGEELFKDDPKKDEKLEFFCNNLVGEKYYELYANYNAFTMYMDDIAFDKPNGIAREKSHLKDVKYLKSKTVKEYIEELKISGPMSKDLIEPAKMLGYDKPEDVNMYELLSKIYKNSPEYINLLQDNPDELKNNFDERLIDFISDTYYAYMINSSHNLYGTESYTDALDENDKEYYNIGKKITVCSEEKSSLTDAEKKAIDKKSNAGRINRMLDCINDCQSKIFTDKAIDAEKMPAFKKLFPAVDRSVNTYSNYIKLHSGINALKSKDSLKTTLSKCLAAETLRISDKAFDIKMLHRIAKRIEEFPTFNSLTAADMVDVLSNPSKIGHMQERFFREAHAVPEINVVDYLDSMKTLHENMKLKDGRSPEYRNLYDCVKFISELDPNSHNFENTLMRANKALLQAVRLYTKGKEKRRTFEGGRDRFDNAMDALAIMSANVPGLKKTITSMVNKINKIRNVNEDHRDFVKLENHGAAAAANRKAVREAAANNNRPNRQSNASRSSSL